MAKYLEQHTDCSKYRKVSQLRSSNLWRNHLFLLSLSIVIRNGKIVWKRGPNCYFHLNLKFLGGHAGNTSKQQKIVAFVRNYSVKMTLELFYPLPVVMTMVPMLLRWFRRLLQIKKSITNAPYVLWFAE